MGKIPVDKVEVARLGRQGRKITNTKLTGSGQQI